MLWPRMLSARFKEKEWIQEYFKRNYKEVPRV